MQKQNQEGGKNFSILLYVRTTKCFVVLFFKMYCTFVMKVMKVFILNRCEVRCALEWSHMLFMGRNTWLTSYNWWKDTSSSEILLFTVAANRRGVHMTNLKADGLKQPKTTPVSQEEKSDFAKGSSSPKLDSWWLVWRTAISAETGGAETGVSVNNVGSFLRWWCGKDFLLGKIWDSWCIWLYICSFLCASCRSSLATSL